MYRSMTVGFLCKSGRRYRKRKTQTGKKHEKKIRRKSVKNSRAEENKGKNRGRGWVKRKKLTDIEK